jgi:hypothetical protein
VLIEIAASLLFFGGFKLAHMLWLTVGHTMSVGALIVLASFGLFAGCSKIDQFSHSKPRW